MTNQITSGTPQSPGHVHGNHEDAEYDAYLQRLNERFLAAVEMGTQPIFKTSAKGLWNAYLGSFPESERQYHNCDACHHFISRFGNLVMIDNEGFTHSLFWDGDDAPEDIRAGIVAMGKIMKKAEVTGVFLSEDRVWGTPKTGVWTHLSVTPPKAMKYFSLTETVGQKMAEKREDFRNVVRGLFEFTEDVLEQAVTLLKSDALYRNEKVLGPAQWLYDLQLARKKAHPGSCKQNVIWKAVAAAPAGFCHPRTSMIGSLLEDIASGMDFEQVSRRFATKMHPLKYQRPQAAPAAGNIAEAEKIIAKLGAAGSLDRRFARVDEIEALWRPKAKQEAPTGTGVFGHLTPKGASTKSKALDIPAQTLTWDKFQRTVLPTADAIEFYTSGMENFMALVTAVDPEAPPILQWDHENRRNPVSGYVWHKGSYPTQFGLKDNAFHKVSAVTLHPSMWGSSERVHQGQSVLFVLDKARETRSAGLAIFPENLKSEFHGIRSTIEAFSKKGKIENMEDSSACGVALSKGGAWTARIRVTTGNQTAEYKLDRWD